MRTITIRLSDKLKDKFDAVCKAREISVSDVIRDLLGKEVRNYERQFGKVAEEESLTTSKSDK